MKKYVVMAVMVFALALPGSARSENPAPEGNGAPPPGGPQAHLQMNEQQFQHHKTEILARMNQHLAEIQKRVACVQAAANPQALHGCLPPPPQGFGKDHEGKPGQGPEGKPGQGPEGASRQGQQPANPAKQ